MAHPIGQVAQLVGISTRRIRQLAADGVLPPIERGKTDLVQTVQGYCKYLRDMGGETSADFHQERARLTKLKADQAQLDLEVRSEGLIRAEDAKALVAAVAAATRRHLLKVPSKLRSSNPDVTAEICENLEEAIVEALEPLADDGAAGGLMARLA